MNEQEVTEKLAAVLEASPLAQFVADPVDIAAALLPVVREVAAEELREAAHTMPVQDHEMGYAIRNGLEPGPGAWLRSRADALASLEAQP